MPTKLKIKENIKKSKNGLENLLLNKRNSPSFPPPKKVKCFQCQTNFYIKFVISRLAYSQKNNWGYWTEQEKDKGKPICNDCLRQIYQDKPHINGSIPHLFCETVPRIDSPKAVVNRSSVSQFGESGKRC